MSKVHIVGAGLAGLSAAVALAKRGVSATIYEQARQAGGRCRSFHDTVLDRRIDNGNHLLLSGNHAVRGYLTDIGAEDSLVGAEQPAFPFVDLQTGERWTVRPNLGRLPWWIFVPSRRVPGTRPFDYLSGIRLARANSTDTVAACFDTDSVMYKRFWHPLAVAALNTAPGEAAATLLWPVVAETFGRGGSACRPLVARHGLSDSFVDPAIAWLQGRGTATRLGHRLRDLAIQGNRITLLDFAGNGQVAVGDRDRVLLTLPPAGLQALLPDVPVPAESRAIVNAHYRVRRAPRLPGNSPVVGVLGGTAEWIFVRDDVVSVTVSAADRLAAEPAESLLAQIWRDVATVLEISPEPAAPGRIVKEKRATFAQTPAGIAHRAKTRTAYDNLFLAGDWTDTGLPATIEGAIRSGRNAVDAMLQDRD